MFHGKLLNRKINGNKKLKSLEDFKNKIRRWELDECHTKLCKDFVSKLGYVNLVGVLDIGLTVRIRIYGLIGSARKVLISVFACSGLTWGDRSGMCNMYRVNNDGNRAMSLMSPWYLYCWLWAYLTVSCFFYWFPAVICWLFRYAPFAVFTINVLVIIVQKNTFFKWCKYCIYFNLNMT